MDKLKIIEGFREYLKKLFPNRAKPINGEADFLEEPSFKDDRFGEWRKTK